MLIGRTSTSDSILAASYSCIINFTRSPLCRDLPISRTSDFLFLNCSSFSYFKCFPSPFQTYRKMYSNSNARFYRLLVPFFFRIIYDFTYCVKSLVFCLMSLLQSQGKTTQQTWINIENYKRLFSRVATWEGNILRRANIWQWTAEV